MEIISLEYFPELNKVNNIKNDNIDVFVKLSDGKEYVLTVGTPEFYYVFMNQEKQNFIFASPPDIIVKELSETNIRNAIEDYSQNDAYWLKLYALAGYRESFFSVKNMGQLIDCENCSFLSIDLESGSDVSRGSANVTITLTSQQDFQFQICTPAYYNDWMDIHKKNFIPAGPPAIIVSDITETNTIDVIKTYFEDEAYWFKWFCLAYKGEKMIEINQLDKLKNELDEFYK